MFSARITRIDQETPTVRSFTLDVGDQPFHFLPGQWIDLYVDIDGEEKVGGYSMTSSPTRQGSFDLAIKQGKRHPVTHYMYERAAVGDTVRVSGGQGVFVFERGMTDQLVLVGAGVGVTPLVSILRYVAEAAPEVGATLIYSIPSPDEFLFRKELADLERVRENIRVIVTVTQPSPDWNGPTGRIGESLLREAQPGDHALHYLCGPQNMVEDVVAALGRLHIPASRIVYEKWW